MGAPFVTTQLLRFCDTDALGHVNNAVYAVMCEAGRAELSQQIGLLAPDGGRAIVLVRLELDFLREMTWPGEVRIETAIQRIGTKSLHVRQRITKGDVLAARAATVLAVMDTATRRAVPVDDALRAELAPWIVEDFA